MARRRIRAQVSRALIFVIAALVFASNLFLLAPAANAATASKAPAKFSAPTSSSDAKSTPSSAAPPAASSQAAPLQLTDDAILDHLNAVIGWYRHVAAIDQGAGQPSDVLYLSNARAQSKDVVESAFTAAEAAAALRELDRTKNPVQADAETSGQQPSDQQNLANALQNANDRLTQVQAQIADLEKQIAHARGKKRAQLTSQRDVLQGEVDLDKAQQETLQKISSFINNSDNARGGLAGKINELKQAAPEVFAKAPTDTSKPSASGQNSNVSRAEASGLIGQAGYLLSQTRDIHDIDRLLSETGHLRDNASNLQKPLRDTLRTLVQQGRAASSQAANADPAQVAAMRANFALLAARFKQISNAALPLRQEIILLDQTRGNLEEWRDSMLHEYAQVLRSLLTRVLIILIALSLVAGLSAIWRRATLRYVQDARRRRQLLLIRRFVAGFLMIVVIMLGFVSEFSSLATFAGFITAGIAVALQTVILSVAAYFTLIGRRGIRVGDRITISGVTGDVLEVGLVRIHLMELGGTGIDLYPTGRVVVFSNSVLFGATPLYKQLPGTAYAWHELALTLAPNTDPALAERVVTGAVKSVYDGYRSVIEHQHAVLERVLDTAFPIPEPGAKWQFSDSGPELVVRYPVEIQHAEASDDKMTRELMHTISTIPELKAALSSPPKLRAAIKA